MATLLSVTANSTTIEYKEFTDTGPRYFIDMIPGGRVYDNKRFRAPGWSGNVLIRSGYTGQQLALIVRYQDTLTNANAAWKTDRDLFAQYNCVINKSIVGETPWDRCTLRPGSGERITDELAYGASGTKFFTVRYVFDVEQPY